MDVVLSVCIVWRGGEVLMYGKYECFVMHMLYVCVLWASCSSSQSCIMHDCSLLMLVEDARGDHKEEDIYIIIYISHSVIV